MVRVRGGMLLIAGPALILATLAVAYANGANDVSKGIATLVGSGVSNYRAAVMWGSAWTMAGALTAGFASQALMTTFSGKGVLLQPNSTSAFVLAVAIGTIGWLVIATRIGLPVSTTHSLAGALIGAAVLGGGLGAVAWPALAQRIVLPLLASPAFSLVLLFVLTPVLRPLAARFDRYCVCADQQHAVTPEGVTFQEQIPTMKAGTAESCATSTARLNAIDALHWISSGATSFFRGLNDTPKILALGIAVIAGSGVQAESAYAIAALAMGAGSLLAGFRVTRTLAVKVTAITPTNGLAANLVTSLLVGLASRYGLPVSTTHVSSGAIIGVGIAGSGGAVRWKTVGEMLLAWVVTVPVSAIVAAAAHAVLR